MHRARRLKAPDDMLLVVSELIDRARTLQSTPPQGLSTAGWPKWAVAGDGSPRWLEMPAPGERLVTERVDEAGQASSGGNRSRIVGP